ncbi:hypothetical protein K443DRAFT_120761 [Laccaria amethystina LaAM-08-1]|uniref:Uncharacterized protein n=1 Tax=Laccaria amethystina LaAM-08-1 TaxID=1095629 RepID=A0A0C9XT85_9AGAR|nr:hypothetical protein K443DRAFT_120761 [Laccaria amethystina LaAM-08-1]
MIWQKTLRITLDSNGGLKFGWDPCTKWILDIHMFMAALQLLCHTTENLEVGWMTEDTMHSPINMLNGPQHVVFETLEGTGGFCSRYHKGLFATVLLEQFIKPEKQHITIKDYWERIWVSMGVAWEILAKQLVSWLDILWWLQEATMHMNQVL